MNLFDFLASEPLAEDIVVIGAGPVRILANGEIKDYPPMVPTDGAVERVIGDLARDDPPAEGGAS